MSNNLNLSQHVTTIHNPESVVEVYLNKEHTLVTEVKSLNYNRYKNYEYPVSEYLEMVKGFKGVDTTLRPALNN